MSKQSITCISCAKTVTTATLSLLRTKLCDDCYMEKGIKVPLAFWQGNTAGQSDYNEELGKCCVCNLETTKQCRLCLQWNCRPTEWTGDCMEIHLRDIHGIEFADP